MAGDAQLLTDLRLRLLHRELRPVYTVATERRSVPTREGLRAIPDMGSVGGKENLYQAILLRLLTPRGELAALGHPDYGSRLHELIGERNSETRRNLIKLYILEALKQESRVEKVVEVTVQAAKPPRDRVDVTLQVKPTGEGGTIAIGPFTLELEP